MNTESGINELDEHEELIQLLRGVHVTPAEFGTSVSETILAGRRASRRRTAGWAAVAVAASVTVVAGFSAVMPNVSRPDTVTGTASQGPTPPEHYGDARAPFCYPRADVHATRGGFNSSIGGGATLDQALDSCAMLWRSGFLTAEGVHPPTQDPNAPKDSPENQFPAPGQSSHPVPTLFACALEPASTSTLAEAAIFPVNPGGPKTCDELGLTALIP